MFWFDRESIIPGNFGFAICVCRLRERGRMSKSVYVRVVHDLELLICSSLSDQTTALISRWDKESTLLLLRREPGTSISTLTQLLSSSSVEPSFRVPINLTCKSGTSLVVSE